jgi:hypothetical protein
MSGWDNFKFSFLNFIIWLHVVLKYAGAQTPAGGFTLLMFPYRGGYYRKGNSVAVAMEGGLKEFCDTAGAEELIAEVGKGAPCLGHTGNRALRYRDARGVPNF